MRLGIYTGDFHAEPASALCARIAALGFEAIQLSFAAVAETGYQNEPQIEFPESVDGHVLALIRDEAARAGLAIAAINGTFNCAHADPAVRGAGIRRFCALADAARALGCAQISLCTGTRSDRSLWTVHQDNRTDEAWRDMRSTIEAIARIAEERRLTLLIETEASSVVNTPEKAARLLREVPSDALKMIIDCANLFGPGEAKPEAMRPAILRAFDAFGPAIRLAHGKDIYASEGIAFAPTGKGIVEFPFFFAQLETQRYAGDLILHGIFDETLMAEAVEFLRPLVNGYPVS